MKTPRHFFLAFLMLITGSINTITTKYADITCAFGVDYAQRDQTGNDNTCPERSEGQHLFNHPFVQALAMFIGEFSCLVVYKLMRSVATCRGQEVKKERDFNPLIFLLPALCDCVATSSMYVGLTLTYASQFQMLRGSVVIFTGLLSKFWLGNTLHKHHWLGMLLVLVGLVLVGLAALLGGSSGAQAKNPLLGDAIIIAAQVIVALQMVVEEKFLGKHDVPPLLAVGWEGIFGMIIMSILSMIFFYIPGQSPGNTFENFNDAVLQITNSDVIKIAICGTIVSIAFFNYSGISVTKEMSATTRMVLDSVRTLTIWAYGMIVGWETFSAIQIVGFIILLSGTFVYNDLIFAPLLRKHGIITYNPDDFEDDKEDTIADETSALLLNPGD